MSEPAPTPVAAPSGQPWWRRVHRALMPDYNRKATAFWWLVVALGAIIVWVALRQVLALPAPDLLVALVGVSLAMLAGLFPVRIPRWKNSFAAGEIFMFLLLLLQGPAAASLAAAGEGLLGSLRTSSRWTSRLATPAMAAVAMYGVGWSTTRGLAALGLRGLDNPGWVLMGTMVGAMLYFVCNTLLVTAVLHLKRSTWPGVGELFGSFGWIGFTHAASASVACLLFLSFQQAGIGVLVAAAPIIALLLLTLHYYFRQREVDDAARQTRLDAAEREAQLAAAHMRELQASEQRFHSAFSHASIGMALVGFDSRVLQANDALCDLLGMGGEGELVASRLLTDFVDARDAAGLLDRIKGLQQGPPTPFASELRFRHRSGAEVWTAVHGSLFTEIASDSPCLILQVQDITARRQAEASLHHIAYHDSLTGLPNRHCFQQVLSKALERARGGQGRPFGLMFLDFDRFKLINDSLGHAVGDEFLVAVARRIQHQLRPGDTVARLGGDEFAILAEDLEGERYAVTLAERLLEALRHPFHVAGTDITSSVSIGITFSTAGYATTSDMLRDADTAMYKAKSAGKGRYALFDRALHVEVSNRLRLEGDLRRALGKGQITLDYQPVFDLATGRMAGFEALARWQHPELGSIAPERFIPVAEESGLMPALTDFVLYTACRQLGLWQRRAPGLPGLHLHINLSDIDVAHPNLVARVNAALAQAGVRPRQLTLELTENSLMQRLEGALPALATLRRAGVGLTIDDFGTGYSSLRHLSSLPVDGLKIAPGFVADIERGPKEEAIVRSIVMMGESLGKSITAEGIETAGQLARLRQAGCASGQGDFLSRPLSVAQVDALLDRLGVDARPAPPRPGDSAYSLLH
jgi:diguanylate cyclase (GGDEF)-like protein/PAS domain S-box-containing protein